MTRSETHPPRATLTLRIEGMGRAEEVTTLTRELAPLLGGEEHLSFDLFDAKLVLSLPAGCSEGSVISAIEVTGMRASPFQVDGPGTEVARRRLSSTALAALSADALVSGFSSHAFVAGGIGAAPVGEGAKAEHAVPLDSRGLYMKLHVGTDTRGVVHSLTATHADAADIKEMPHLLHGEESSAYGDQAYWKEANRHGPAPIS